MGFIFDVIVNLLLLMNKAARLTQKVEKQQQSGMAAKQKWTGVVVILFTAFVALVWLSVKGKGDDEMFFASIFVIGVGFVALLLNSVGRWVIGFITTIAANNDAGKGAQENRTHTEETDNGNSRAEESIPISWFRILEVSQGASKEQIVTAYKQKIRQYHPDKVAQMGAEIQELAEFKSKQINAAYDYAMKLRG